MNPAIVNKDLENDMSNHIVDAKDNEVHDNNEEDDEEDDDADSTLRRNKTKKLVRKEKSTAVKLYYTRFICLIVVTLYIF